ncbi:hypothetical protein [Actinomadura sp. 7K507]|uniref:hypothetical protein n=1 Tax=Actinomadura sp. 7K507 TaxID=2530365 RepID=UPI00104817FB|nr:hypothetical protein [Actinomadura sp. 7K507]TDC72826.1 hypothetical protein E1285_45010 [Actinomadura sp. 7K507]
MHGDLDIASTPALTALTIVAGLASTVFAPLTDALAPHLTWRGTYLVLAAIHAAVTIPLHAIALRRHWPRRYSRHAGRQRILRQHRGRRAPRASPFLLLTVALPCPPSRCTRS